MLILTVAFLLSTFSVIVESTNLAHNDGNYLISRFIKNLLREFELGNSRINDLGIFRISKFGRSSQRIDDLYEDVYDAIPWTMPVHYSPLDKIVENRNLRVSSFIIIISDVANEVNFITFLKTFK